MAPLFIDPGLLRRRSILEAAVPVPDESGGAALLWQEVAEMSVHVEPLSVATAERFGQREAVVTHRVICRARPEVDRGMAFVVGTRRLVILSVHDPDDSGRYLVCRCEEAR
ncbi:phage head closure protein [Aureimonas glaciei]|jgi:SPP1 family predicted phage head-tail adaptor|uniref:Phage head-tail adaptor n=1 Tax=Aureimonas glaciei TaxID=1776957 RepID=A0A916XUQ1_9HYPH|nr:phage head closure protein [Aureimonas glaciei]GGD12436.1 hypothetical protein GCM10011335_14160 [Aureimonas glaciei]